MYANAQRISPLKSTIGASMWPPRGRSQKARRSPMLYTIAVILVVLWLLGLATAYTLGGFIHILLVIAIIAVLLRVINGRTPL
jgi:hypothetical protein